MAYYEDEVISQGQSKFFAVQDAARRNKKNRPLFSDLQALSAELLVRATQSVFERSRVYLNYRETMITVKVSSPKAADKLKPEWDLLKEHLAQTGVKFKTLRSNYIFEIHYN
jgi:hypothetical protein